MSDALKLAIKLTRRDMRRASMKLDDEMRQACALALNVIPANLSPNHIAAFAAGYRMGLERAAKACDDAFGPTFRTHRAAARCCAADIRKMIREMAND